MFAEERQEKIFQIVTQRNSVKVSELSDELDISEVTIRRDLDALQRQKRIIRTHGGAMAAYSVGKATLYSQLASKQVDLKRQIAMAAYEMIQDDETILLDNSSTVSELANLIASGNRKNLRIITNSLIIPQLLSEADNCTVQIVGGEVNFKYQATEGSAACQILRDIRVDKCFIGINGVDEEFGFSTPRYVDADVKRCMLHSAHCSIVLADHTKLGKTYLAKIAKPDYLITDEMLAGFAYENLTGTTVIFANERIHGGTTQYEAANR